jgi:hypothetical protein
VPSAERLVSYILNGWGNMQSRRFLRQPTTFTNPTTPSPKIVQSGPFALVSLNEPVAGGHRIAQVEDAMFPVASGLEWKPVSSDVKVDRHYWDGEKAVPVPITATPVLHHKGGVLPTKLA